MKAKNEGTKCVRGRRMVAGYIYSREFQLLDLESSNKVLDSLTGNDLTTAVTARSNEHLYVLCHGLSAFKSDLGYLREALIARGCHVLMSECNEFTKSFKGTTECSEAIVAEIIARREALGCQVKFLSIVGNSFGGIIGRVAVKMLHERDWLGLSPCNFMTIATPHLGVRFHTYIEETMGVNLPFRDQFVGLVSSMLSKSGAELLLNDTGEIKDDDLTELAGTLMYRLATERPYLDALACFRQRRAYANLYQDSVVPLQTGGFFSSGFTASLRERHRQESGIVAVVVTERAPAPAVGEEAEQPRYHASRDELLGHMAASLDAIGWSKVVCHYPSLLPTAHSKLAAITRFPEFLHSGVLGFQEGQEGMRHAAEWLLLHADEADDIAPFAVTLNPLLPEEGKEEGMEGAEGGAIRGDVLHV